MQKNGIHVEEAKRVRRIVKIVIVSIIGMILIGGVSGYLYVKSALGPVDPKNEKAVKVDIPIGSSPNAIANILEKEDIIKDKRVFRLYVKYKNEGNFQAGNYTLTKSLTLGEVVQSLKEGKTIAEPIYKVTIPEGKTIDEIATIYAEKLPIKKEAFIAKVNDPAYIDQLMKEYPELLTKDILNKQIRTPLEGYLFAATYNFYDEKPSVEEIVKQMLDKSNEVITPYLSELKTVNLTTNELVTMASLIEKESGTVDQRKEIAGVFYNRLKEDMRLQTDPTVLYALGKHKHRILYKDLEVESPYNTYKIAGLPVGPIANFGNTAMEAAIHPDQSKYKYFLHDPEGNIYYAETYEAHLKLKEQYIK